MSVTIKNSKELDPNTVCAFMNTFATWKVHPQAAKWDQILSNSAAVVTAWDGEMLIGFVRGISDGIRYAQVLDVLVHPDYRRRGIGKRLIDRLLDEPPMQVRAVMLATPDKFEFYESVGFQCVNDRAYFMVRVRDKFGDDLVQPVAG
jgi:ribosomal protein S18 acetylase RimI-like enzyme